jgi:hypothetical protein
MMKKAAVFSALLILGVAAASALAFDVDETTRDPVMPAPHYWSTDSRGTQFFPVTTRAAFLVWAAVPRDLRTDTAPRFVVYGIDANRSEILFQINAALGDWDDVQGKLNAEIRDIAIRANSIGERMWSGGMGEINKPPPIDPSGPIGDWMRAMLRAAHRTMLAEIQLFGR